MKKLLTILLLFTILLTSALPAFAVGDMVTDEQATAIQNLLDNAQRTSRAPGISVAILIEGETHFFSSGVANLETEILADEETLWEIASIAKSFTAVGILYLEEQGLLSLTDSIETHLPWFTLQYRGQTIDMQEVRLYHFLHHTSGFTNRRHPNPLLAGSRIPDTLQDTVEVFVDANLAFMPGTQFEYGNVNYNVLGLVIESVSGQSYEAFMEEQIFGPLGLASTFADRDAAYSTNRFAQGCRSDFVFFQRPFDSPEARGSKPTGHLISSAQDMARWMGIHLGMVVDIPEIFERIIARAHEPGQSVAEGDGTFYAAGWEVSADRAIVEHAGNSLGFTAHVLLLPQEQIAIAVLSNIAQGNMSDVAFQISDILSGNMQQSLGLSTIQMLDIGFSIATILGVLLAILFLILGLHRRKQSHKVPITKKKVISRILWDVVTTVAVFYFVPRLVLGFGTNWQFLLNLAPYSILVGLVALTLMTVSITWFRLSKTTIK